MRYVVAYERSAVGSAAYVPDPPGCIAPGETREETDRLIREAIVFHLAGLRGDNEPIPELATWTGTVDDLA